MLNIKTLTDTLSRMELPQLQRYAKLHKDDPYIVSMALSIANQKKQMQAGQAGRAGMQPQPKVADQQIAQMAAPQQEAPTVDAMGNVTGYAGGGYLPEDSGIATLPAQNMQNFAGGGIVAFDDGGQVPGYAGGIFTGTPLTSYIDKYAQEYKLDPSVLSRIVAAESKGKTTAKNPESTAHGAGQLLDNMWKKMGGGDRQDAETQVRNAAKLLRSNTDNFKNATGREPSASEAYVTWVLGDSTGRAVLAADPKASVEDVIKKADPNLGNDIIKKNASIFKDKSVADVTQWAANKTKLPSIAPVSTATATPTNPAIDQIPGQSVKAPPAKAAGITALTGDGNFTDPMTGFSVPQDVFSPSPEEERKYAAAKAEAKKVEDVVSQIPGQSVKAPAYKDTNTYFGGVADEMGIPQEVQRNVANTINATSGFTSPLGGVNRAASTVSKGLEPTAEMIQKAAQAKQVAETPRLLPPAKAGLEALDEASAATRAAAENTRRMRQLEQDRKAAVGAEQSVDAATKSAAIADKLAKEQAALVDASRLGQAKMTGAAQGLAMTQAADKAGLFPQGGGVSSLVPETAPAMAPPLPSGILAPVAGEDVVDKIKEATGASTAELKQQAADSGMDYNSFLTRLGFGLMAGESQYASVNVGKAGLGALDAQLAEQKAKSEAEYRRAMGKHYTMPSSAIQELEWARDPNNMKLLRQIAQAKADPKASAQEALAFLKDNGVILKETDPVLYNALRNKVLGYAVPQVQEVAGTRS